MRDPRLLCVSAVLFLSVGVGVRAQTATRSAPGLMGLWKPVVGAGASYEVRKPGQPAQPFEFAVVGRDAVQGKDAVWVEFTISAEQIGVVIVKELVAFDAVKMRMRTLKAVIELPGHPPMALPDDMMQSGRPFEFKDVRAGSIDLGIQSVSTPAGTFSCEHYRAKDGSSEFWVSKRVVPIGLVESRGKGETVTLVKLVTNAKDKISGTPQPFDPMMFIPQRPQP